jgi:molecular chaperone GrpE
MTDTFEPDEGDERIVEEAQAILDEAPAPPAEEAVAADAVAPPDPIAQLTSERDGYLDDLRRLQAEFENFRKRSVKQQTDLLERAAETLVRELLPVLDVADLARAHGADDQVGVALFDVLGKEGLERLDPIGQPFDPAEHDAVMHEEGDGDPEVLDVMRAGYRWRGRLLRPAMVKVKGG